ncbi:MAG: hypothetical protein IJL87_04255 [Clostridia bacterium]|nr:hypothetical protein [Clostridia bacterium]
MSQNKNEHIREFIDNIEPAAGAKERMLANIKRKADEQTLSKETAAPEHQNTKVISINSVMKWVLPVAACFVIAVIGANVLSGISKAPGNVESGSQIMVTNPFVSVENVGAIKETLGFSIDAPVGADDVSYSIIDNEIADIKFMFEGYRYNLRASKQSGDFSGLYGVEASTVQIDSGRDAILTVIEIDGEQCTKINWTNGSVNFVLSNTDGASKEDVAAVYERIK